MKNTSDILLSGRNVSRVFHTGSRVIKVLDNADFQFGVGSFTAVIGRSGAGKTTLLNLCGGVDRPDSGVIEFRGSPMEKLSDKELAHFRNQHVGFIFQNFFLRDNRTVLDNVMVPLLLGDRTVTECRKRASEAIEEVGLASMIHIRSGLLSGGQKQRVAIARAISNKPDLILADEPTGSLDTETSHEILELLSRYNRERGATIIVVTHDPMVEKLGIPMITVRDGKVLPVHPDVHLGDIEPTQTSFPSSAPAP